ncbi:MAG: SPASM domain-containing protein [Hyphomicrobiales bacterium]
MQLESFRTCIDKTPPALRISFSGYSEPFLNPACVDMILYAHERGHPISIFTTLDKVRKEDIDRLAGVPFRTFTVHLPDEGHLMRLRVDEGYIELIRHIQRTRLSNVGYHCNVHKPHPLIESALANEISITRNRPVHTRAGNVCESKSNNLEKGYCGKGSIRRNVLIPNGDVALCCMDYGLEHILGNLLTASYESLFESEEFATISRSFNDPKIRTLCRRCEHYRVSSH